MITQEEFMRTTSEGFANLGKELDNLQKELKDMTNRVTLGINLSASPCEIKKAYRKMAMKFHPDRNPGDKQAETSFKEIKEAYETLTK